MTMSTIGYGDVVRVLGHNIATLSAACPPRYGDVVAVTRGERLVAIVCMLYGAFVFGYIIGAVSGVVAMRDHKARGCAWRRAPPASLQRPWDPPAAEAALRPSHAPQINKFHIVMRDLNAFMNEGSFAPSVRIRLREYFRYRSEQAS